MIYPSRSLEQSKLYPHRALLNSEQVHRIYLDELGEVQSLPLTVAATVLTITDEAEAPAAARCLLERAEQEAATLREKQDIIDIVTSIMVYKFVSLSQAEVRAMLGLNLTEEPRAIREAKEEGREEATLNLVIRLLTKRFGELPEELRSPLSGLSLSALEALGEALLDFTSLDDLQAWLAERG